MIYSGMFRTPPAGIVNHPNLQYRIAQKSHHDARIGPGVNNKETPISEHPDRNPLAICARSVGCWLDRAGVWGLGGSPDHALVGCALFVEFCDVGRWVGAGPERVGEASRSV